jgi:hypothetical protein
MKTSLKAAAVLLALGVSSVAIVGCGSSSASSDKMSETGHMGGDAMGSEKTGMDAMEGDKMGADAPMNDKMEPMKMGDKMDDGKM